MKKVKKITNRGLFFLLLFWSIALPITAYGQGESLPEAPTDFYLDQLNILAEDTKQLINNKGEFYKEQPENPQVVLATIESTNGDSIDSYAPELFDKWQIGNKEHDNGILILYALNDGDRNVRIEVGYGLEDVITDSTAMNILVSQKDKLKSSDPVLINEGLRYVFNAVATLIDQDYGYPTDEHALSQTELDGFYEDEDDDVIYTSSSNWDSGDGEFLFVLLLMVPIWILSAIFGKGDGGSGSSWGGGSSSGGSWGGGGGSSSGGGFSGGGGNSGGGGASI
ncbi:TPM domain-containing protein [Enterococcus sp. DIV0242_7C1]|uniref:TPM domain-containing protein n=1 Tax=Candidatus Enterococcus dunnyi TaxID=1834192 RepID=A0A200IZ63_9ENTE|nr:MULTISPECIES: TPM domain-containing protein [unclassified Enterococcus]MBO0470369.1 TPM domain-containing protein [Enterococcus sp. DIV0242_7C1]OUZ30262.1 hypothetical protein A5889_002550 [Enterococcus sp. 9D6_DIV0238]